MLTQDSGEAFPAQVGVGPVLLVDEVDELDGVASVDDVQALDRARLALGAHVCGDRAPIVNEALVQLGVDLDERDACGVHRCRGTLRVGAIDRDQDDGIDLLCDELGDLRELGVGLLERVEGHEIESQPLCFGGHRLVQRDEEWILEAQKRRADRAPGTIGHRRGSRIWRLREHRRAERRRCQRQHRRCRHRGQWART